MKRLLFLLLLIWGAGNLAYTQYRGPITPPPILKETFEKDFPDAKPGSDVWWEQSASYAVDFKQDSYKMKGFYSRTGKWKYTEIQVSHDHLKQKVFQHLDKSYPGYSIDKSILHDEHGNNYYQVNILWKGSIIRLKFQEDGTYIGKTN